MGELAAETQQTLRGAGWFPGRLVDTSSWRESYAETGLVMHEAAASFLGEFGGLLVDYEGSGITRAREAFELDPALIWSSEEDRFIEWGQMIGRRLFPVGELDHGRCFLGIDEHSELYAIEIWVAAFGRMPVGMDSLVLGVIPRKIA